VQPEKKEIRRLKNSKGSGSTGSWFAKGKVLPGEGREFK